MKHLKTTRRQFIKTAALGAAALTAPPFVHRANAAGSLSVALWDHWVPGANAVQEAMIKEWGAKNKVDVTVDFITSIGEKNTLTATAEARAKTGHDVFQLPQWYPSILRKSLEPVDDVVAQLTKSYGKFTALAEYTCKHDGAWRAIPGPTGSHNYPMVSRLDLFKQHCNVDLTKIFPASGKRDPKLVATWTYDNFLVYAEKLHKAGFPFGNPIGQTSDTNSWLGPLFASFGATLVDAKGNITVNSDAVKQVMEYMKKLTQWMPPEVYAWDDAGNNRWIISGRGSCIQNPPSAWTVAKRDKPEVAAQLWHHDTPRGPKGSFRGCLLYNWALFNFSKNKPAAKDLMVYMASKPQVHKLITASQGYDMPQVPSYLDHEAWVKAEPPVGGQYNYPIRGEEQQWVGGMPAPAAVAGQIYVQSTYGNLIARYTTGQNSMNDAIKWAENELEGFLREG